MVDPNECEKCAHDLASSEPDKGHFEKDGVLVCKQCSDVCRLPTPAVGPMAAPSVSPIAATPGDVESLARAVASKMSTLRNEMIWKTLQQPGVIIQTVDGGYILESRWGETAVRVDIDAALVKAREWLMPRV